MRRIIKGHYYQLMVGATSFRELELYNHAMVRKFKRHPTAKLASKLANAATFDSQLRTQCITELGSMNSRFTLDLYCGIMGGLIVHESQEVVDFHREFFNRTSSSSSSSSRVKDLAMAAVQFGALRSPEMVQQIISLYDSLPNDVKTGMFDLVVPTWVSMGVSSHVKPFVLHLIRTGKTPRTEAGYAALAKIIGNEAGELVSAVVENAKPTNRLLRRTIRIAGRDKANQLAYLKLLATLNKKYLNDEFWQAVIRWFDKLSWFTIEQAMDQVGYTLDGVALDEYATKQLTVEGCQEAMEKYKSRRRATPGHLYGRMIHMQIKRDICQGRSRPSKALELFQSFRKQTDDAVLIKGYMYGFLYGRVYNNVIRIHKRLQDFGADDQGSWSMALMALCKKRQMRKAQTHLATMLDKGYKLKEPVLVEYVIGLVEYGRRVQSIRRRNFSHPLRQSRDQTPRPHSPFTLHEITQQLDFLNERGYIFNASYLPRLIARLDMVQGLILLDIQQLLLYIVRLHMANETIPPSTAEEKILIRYWRQVEGPGSRFAVLTNKDIHTLVQLGFAKCPTQPWRAARLLLNLRRCGLDISKQAVMSAYTEKLGKYYGHHQLKGEDKRIRSQMDKSLSVNDVIDNVNRVWDGKMYKTRSKYTNNRVEV